MLVIRVDMSFSAELLVRGGQRTDRGPDRLSHGIGRAVIAGIRHSVASGDLLLNTTERGVGGIQ
jgi:hypothetical protein